MAPEWTDSPETIIVMVAIVGIAASVALFDTFNHLREGYRRARKARPSRRHLHL